MTKKIVIILGIILLFIWACQSKPKNFSIPFRNVDTGLSRQININGYYVSAHACDTSLYTVFMFYSNGLFTIATTSTLHDELINCFIDSGYKKSCDYPLWGTYTISDDTIKTQVIRTEGDGVVILRDYKILPDKQIINISDYVEPIYTNLAYMENYPSFMNNPCPTVSLFYPLSSKRDSTECPFIHKKWFFYPN